MRNGETSTMLAGQLERLLSQAVDTKLLAAAENGESIRPFCDAIEDLGLAWAMVSEEAGGAGLGWMEVAGLFETMGYYAAPCSTGEEIAANRALDNAEMPLPDRAPVIAAERLRLDPNTGRVSGVCTFAWAGETLLLAVASSPSSANLCLLDVASGAVSPLQTVGRDPRSRCVFEDTQPFAISRAPVDPESLISGLAIVRAGQISGALSRILTLSIEYANTRVQFGRPIGKFQAVQHMIAELSAEAAAARAGLQLAARALDAGCGWEAAAIAKIRASLAAGKGAMLAHEVHGAIGVTEEHVLHHLTRRLWQWRDEAGSEHDWSEKLGRLHLSRGGLALWSDLVGISR